MSYLMIIVTLIVLISAFLIYEGARYIGEHKNDYDRKYKRMDAMAAIALLVCFTGCLGMLSYVLNTKEKIETMTDEQKQQLEEVRDTVGAEAYSVGYADGTADAEEDGERRYNEGYDDGYRTAKEDYEEHKSDWLYEGYLEAYEEMGLTPPA